MASLCIIPDSMFRHDLRVGDCLSHLPSYFWNAVECQRRESKSRARAVAPCQLEGHDRCVYAGCQSAEKGSAEQASADGLQEESFGLSECPAKWTKLDHEENWGFRASCLFCWRPRRDLNPCYRRERASFSQQLNDITV